MRWGRVGTRQDEAGEERRTPKWKWGKGKEQETRPYIKFTLPALMQG